MSGIPDYGPEALERFLSDLASADLERMPSLDLSAGNVNRLPSLDVLGSTLFKSTLYRSGSSLDTNVRPAYPSTSTRTPPPMPLIDNDADILGQQSPLSIPPIPKLEATDKSANSFKSNMTTNYVTTAKAPGQTSNAMGSGDHSQNTIPTSSTNVTDPTMDNTVAVAAAARSVPPPVKSKPRPEQKVEAKANGVGRPARRAAASNASVNVSQVAESLLHNISEPNAEPSEPRPNKRKKPDIDWQSIEDPEERRHQRRLAKNRRTAAVSRERKRKQMSALIAQVAELQAQKEELVENLKARAKEATLLRKQLDAVRQEFLSGGAAAVKALLM